MDVLLCCIPAPITTTGTIGWEGKLGITLPQGVNKEVPLRGSEDSPIQGEIPSAILLLPVGLHLPLDSSLCRTQQPAVLHVL